MSRVKGPTSVFTGVFLIAVAFVAFYLASPLGNFTNLGIGPGFVPNMFAFIQLVMGVMLVVDGFVQVGEQPEPWRLRPVLLILASIGFFAMTIEPMGLAIALTGLILISCAANSGTRFYEAAALAVGSVVFSDLVFVRALGLSISMWPTVF